MLLKRIAIVVTLIGLGGCVQAPSTESTIDNSQLTVGVVQKEISVGMDAADVAVAIGSPNIVKKSSLGAETWIYDRFHTEQVFKRSSGALAFISGDVAGMVSGSRGTSRSSSSSLTVVIKFDDESRVESLAYHRSKF